MNYVIIFFVMVFTLSIGFVEAERDTTISIGEYWSEVAERPTIDISFEEEMEKQDSLWQVIQAIELLEDNYFILDKREWKLKKEFGRMMPVIESYIRRGYWELIRYEGDIGIDYGDSIMVKKK